MKNKYVAGILALILGNFGIHYFYLGKHVKGILCMLFSWSLIPAVIATITGLAYLFMSEESFRLEYQSAPMVPETKKAA